MIAAVSYPDKIALAMMTRVYISHRPYAALVRSLKDEIFSVAAVLRKHRILVQREIGGAMSDGSLFRGQRRHQHTQEC